MMTTVPPEAILFGGIGALTETSDLERTAFNAAFEEADLPWHWGPKVYTRLVQYARGPDQIRVWASEAGDPNGIDIAAIYQSQQHHLADIVAAVDLPLRPGVAELVTRAAETNTRLALVTTAPQAILDQVLRAVYPPIGRADFATVITADQVRAPKPAGDCYRLALSRLGLSPAGAIAIEDTPHGVAAARSAHVAAVAFPSLFHQGSDFGAAGRVVDTLASSLFGLDRSRPARKRGGGPD